MARHHHHATRGWAVAARRNGRGRGRTRAGGREAGSKGEDAEKSEGAGKRWWAHESSKGEESGLCVRRDACLPVLVYEGVGRFGLEGSTACALARAYKSHVVALDTSHIIYISQRSIISTCAAAFHLVVADCNVLLHSSHTHPPQHHTTHHTP